MRSPCLFPGLCVRLLDDLDPTVGLGIPPRLLLVFSAHLKAFPPLLGNHEVMVDASRSEAESVYVFAGFDGTLRHRLHNRRTERWLQMVRYKGNYAPVPVWLRAFLHHFFNFQPPVHSRRPYYERFPSDFDLQKCRLRPCEYQYCRSNSCSNGYQCFNPNSQHPIGKDFVGFPIRLQNDTLALICSSRPGVIAMVMVPNCGSLT